MKKGFTLSEVMLVLSVIGVIAALTIPGLTQNLQNKQYRTAYKKAFSEVNQILLRAANEDGLIDINGSDTNVNTDIQIMAQYLNSSKICTNSVTQGCWVDNCNVGDQDCYWSTPGSNDQGMGFGFIDVAGRAWTHYKIGPGYFIMLVDINGSSKPNKLGRDRFPLFFYDDNNVANVKAPVKVRPPSDLVAPAASNCKFGECYYTSWLQ